ncbi:uncharacterized protein [Nicotiana sylvestris]|uniref:uncharacterized protein n=1 Tax=Nicotiana sylvestris TaxID=4096 RepID=UPI00388CD801
MSNPQDNPGTHPPPSPSNSSSTTPPSASPKPRLRRVKILARKTVASGALGKALNKRLKASQVKESQAPNYDSSSESESYQSATEGEGHESSDSKKIQESPSKRDEPVPSTEETLADLLKKVGASYDPKKCRTPTTKAPNVPKPSKKRKASSPTPTASSLPRGRATRSKVKQSEDDLQRALEESKKKRKNKGKGKIAESSEVVEKEEMELVHQERAKRTRSAVKTKQSKVSDDDDWSGKEEENNFEKEQDKLAIFGRRKILKGRLLKDLVEPGMMRLVDALAAQGWKDMVL